MAEFDVAIVGAGGISRAHIAAAKATHGKIGVGAVIDPNEAARKGAMDTTGAKGFASFEEFITSPSAKTVGGVLVCTPPSLRIPIVKAALGKGLAVLAEKPLAHTLADAKAQVDIAAQFPKLVGAVGYCHRFTPGIIEMKKRIAAGEIGQLSRFENTFAAPLMKMENHWMSDPAISGGGSFIDTGCHSLDLFLYLIGTGKVLSAVFSRAWAGRGESGATALLRSEGGAHGGVAGVIQSGWIEPARFVVTVVGTKGSFTYDYDHATELRFRSNEEPEQKIAVETHELRFQRQLEAFADAASGKSPAVQPATFAEGLITAQWVDDTQKIAGRN